MVKANLAKSKGEARRKIEQGGVRISDQIIKDAEMKIEKDLDGQVVKVGKREFRKIKIS
ncbi:MAG: S4 domain-containing protein [Ignavibacteriaceae bacterium]